jgi:hypothetical protein
VLNNTVAIRQEAQRLIDRDGFISQASIVAAARNTESPLHPYFTWDDSVAAEERRLQQAGALLRRIRVHLVMIQRPPREVAVTVERVERAPRSVRWLQAPRSVRGDGGGFRSMSQIVDDELLAADMVETLRSELTAFIRRAQDYCDAASAAGRDEPLLQSVVTAISDICNEAWPSAIVPAAEGDGREATA